MEVKEDTSLVGAQESESQQCWSKLDQYATKNVLVISLSFLLLFTAFNGLQFLQSSLNTEAGLGLTSISVLYAVFTAANLLSLAPMVISKVGHKWAMVISMSAYLLWVLMNGCASWYTLVPAAVLVGLAAGPLWVAHSSYLTITATDVANKCGEDMEVIIHRYFGVFFFVFSLSGLVGPAISSAVLHVDDEGIAVYNSSYAATLWERCGARDCPDNPLNETAIETQDPRMVWLLVGVYGGCIMLAMFLMALTLDNASKAAEPFTMAQGWQMVTCVVRYHRDWPQFLLIPVCLQQGWTIAFTFGEFTKSFGSCVYGVWMVGMVTLPHGLSNTIMSLVTGGLVKYTGRLLLMTAAQGGDMALMIALLFWNGEGGLYALYSLSALLGITHSIKTTILNGTISCLFPEDSEVAFCANRFWGAIGWVVPFAYSKYLCTSTKLWVIFAITALAASSYIALEKPCCAKKKVGSNFD